MRPIVHIIMGLLPQAIIRSRERKIYEFEMGDVNRAYQSKFAANRGFGLATMLSKKTLSPKSQAQEQWQF